MKLRAAGLVVALVITAAPLVNAPSSAADRDRHDPVTERSEGAAGVRLEGRGFGHGHGLSQHGAQSAAEQGRTYRQILGFYYPGLRWGQSGGTVSVQISADTSSDVVVSARSRLRVTGLGEGRPSVALSRRGATLWRITPARGGDASTISYRTDRWRVLRTLPGDAQLTAGGRPITLHTPSGRVAYRGALRSASPSTTGVDRDTVNIVPLDSYLKGVVPREVPALWKPHAVRSQAVAARTYASYERARPLGRHYQICDTSQCQVYGGFSAEHPASNAAIDGTRGQVLLSRGAPAFTQFSASNGGFAAQGGFAYLPAKADPYDTAYRGWQVTVSGASIEGAFPALGTFRRLSVVERDGHGAWGGRATQVRIVGSRTTTTVSADTFRSIFGLRSTWFRPL